MCKHCDYEGKAERGYLPRPSNVKTKICPSCKASAYQEDWWEDWEVEEYDQADLGNTD